MVQHSDLSITLILSCYYNIMFIKSILEQINLSRQEEPGLVEEKKDRSQFIVWGVCMIVCDLGKGLCRISTNFDESQQILSRNTSQRAVEQEISTLSFLTECSFIKKQPIFSFNAIILQITFVPNRCQRHLKEERKYWGYPVCGGVNERRS